MTDCTRCRTPLEYGDLRCAVCAEIAPTDALPAPVGELVAEVMRCEGCGAATRYSAEARGLACAFCASVMHREDVIDPIERAQGYLPFTVDGDAARGQLRSWLGSLGWFRPSDLLDSAQLESLRPLWWVGWVFNAHALVSWTCDSNAGARSSSWAPHAGQRAMTFTDVAISASRGLSDEEAYELIPSYDVDGGLPAPAEVQGAPTEPILEEFNVQRSQARARVLAAIDSVAAARVRGGIAPGSTFRKVSVACLLQGLETRRLAFPAWVLAYRYRDQLYRVVISGQDAGTLLGKAPWSWARILLVVGVAAAVLLGLVAALVAA